MSTWKSLIRGCALALLVLPLVGGVGDASAQNLLINGDFETGDLTGWEASGLSGVSTIAVESPDNGPSFGGSHNAFFENRAQAIGMTLKQVTPVGSATAGPAYYSFDLKLIEAAIGGVVFYEIFAEQEGVGIIGGSGLQGPVWPWNEWTFYEGTFAAPVGTDFLTIQFVATTGATEGSNCVMNLDNVYLSQGGPPVPNETNNWGSVKALFR